MNPREKFLLDLRGYLVIPGFLSADELVLLNDAVDAQSRDAMGALHRL